LNLQIICVLTTLPQQLLVTNEEKFMLQPTQVWENWVGKNRT